MGVHFNVSCPWNIMKFFVGSWYTYLFLTGSFNGRSYLKKDMEVEKEFCRKCKYYGFSSFQTLVNQVVPYKFLLSSAKVGEINAWVRLSWKHHYNMWSCIWWGIKGANFFKWLLYFFLVIFITLNVNDPIVFLPRERKKFSIWQTLS